MTGPDIYTQLRNVLDGKTADGSPGSWKPTHVDVPTEGTLALLMLALFRDISCFDPLLLGDDRTRTALLRVGVHWTIVTRSRAHELWALHDIVVRFPTPLQ